MPIPALPFLGLVGGAPMAASASSAADARRWVVGFVGTTNGGGFRRCGGGGCREVTFFCCSGGGGCGCCCDCSLPRIISLFRSAADIAPPAGECAESVVGFMGTTISGDTASGAVALATGAGAGVSDGDDTAGLVYSGTASVGRSHTLAPVLRL
jgi:hypothetical protein